MTTFFNRLICFCLILVVLGAILIALLPTLASTEWGRKQVVSWINHTIPGAFEIRSLKLQWSNGQELEGILLKDPQGHSVLQIEKFSTEATLWQLLRKSTHLGFTQIIDLNASIQTDEIGSTNLHNALGIAPHHLASAPLFPSTTLLSDVNVDLSLFSERHPLSAKIKGITKQDKLNGSFEINMALQTLEASNWDELSHDVQQYLSIEGSKDAKIDAHVINFPVDLLDRITSLFNPKLNGLFHSLLGDKLNLSVEKEPSPVGLAFNLTAQSPLMQGTLKGKVENGLMMIQEPGSFHFNLTPDFVNPFVIEHFKLLNSTLLKVVFHSLVFPLSIFDSDAQVDPCQFEFKTQYSIPKTEIDIPGFGPLSVLDLNAHLNTPACAKTIDLQFAGKALHGLEAFDLNVNTNLIKPSNLSHFQEQILQNLHTTINLSNLPLQLFLPQLQKKPEIIELIGSPIDSQIILSSKGHQEWEAVLSLQTPKVKLKEAKFLVNKEVLLASPAQLELTISENCLNALVDKQELTLAQPCSIRMLLKNIRFSLDDPTSGKFQVEASVPSMQFTELLTWGSLKIQDMVLSVEGAKLTHLTSKLDGKFSILKPDGTVSPLLQDPAKIAFYSNWEIGKDTKIDMPFGHFEIKNPLLDLEMEGKLATFTTLELTQAAQINYILTPSALEEINRIFLQGIPEIEEKSSLKLTIDPTLINLKTISVHTLKFKGALAIDHLRFADAGGTHPLIEKVELPWELNIPENHFAADLKGFIYTNEREKPSPFSTHIQLWLTPDKLDAAHTKAEIQMHFDGMPTTLLSAPLTTHDLNPIIGPLMDINFKAFLDPSLEKPGYVDLSIDSENFHVKGRFKVDHSATIFDENKIPNFRLTITPASLESIKKFLTFPNDFNFVNPVTLSGQMTQFNLPFKESWVDHARVDFTLTTTDILWQNSSSAPFNIESHLSSQNLSESLQFSLKAGTATPLTVQGSLAHPFDLQGKINDWRTMALQAKLEGSKLAPAFVQSLSFGDQNISKKLQALFGDTLDINVACQLKNMTGSVLASVTGPQGQVSFDGKVDQGIVTLNRPLEGSVKLTPLFTQTFLKPNVPLLGTAVDSENAIKFSLSPDQFSCPLSPFQLNKVKIGKGMLNLGKIRFRNEGELSSVLSFVHAISEPYYTIWFTPLFFNLDQGILSLKRLDLLVANSYTLASWGSLDLNKQQADLILGLSAQSLEYAFGIKDLDEQYLLQIPLRSAKGKVEIDKKKATGRITALIAQNQGGVKGKIFGSILDAALSPGGDATPPQPAQPFPWKDEFKPSQSKENTNDEGTSSAGEQNTSDTGDVKKKRKRKKQQDLLENPLKDVQDGAIQVLDQLFGK